MRKLNLSVKADIALQFALNVSNKLTDEQKNGVKNHYKNVITDLKQENDEYNKNKIVKEFIESIERHVGSKIIYRNNTEVVYVKVNEKEYGDAKKMISTLEKNGELYRTRINELKNGIEKCENEKSKCGKEKRKLEDKVGEQNKLIEKYEVVIGKLENENSNLSNEMKNLRVGLEEKQREILNLNVNIKYLKSKIREMEKNIGNKNDENARLMGELSECKNRERECGRNMDELGFEIDALYDEFIKVLKIFAIKNVNIDTSNNLNLSGKCEKMLQFIIKIKQNSQELRNRISDLEREIRNMNDENIKKINILNREYEEKMSELVKQNESKMSELKRDDRNESEISELVRRNELSIRRLNSVRDMEIQKIKLEYERKLNEKQDEINILKQKNGDLKNQIVDNSDSFVLEDDDVNEEYPSSFNISETKNDDITSLLKSELELKIEKLRSMLDEKHRQLQDIDKEKTRIGIKYGKVFDKNIEMNKELNLLKINLTNSRQEFEDIESKYNVLNIKYKEQNLYIEELRNQVDENNNRINNLKENLKQARNRINDIEIDVENNNKNEDKHNSLINNLRNQLKVCEKRLNEMKNNYNNCIYDREEDKLEYEKRIENMQQKYDRKIERMKNNGVDDDVDDDVDNMSETNIETNTILGGALLLNQENVPIYFLLTIVLIVIIIFIYKIYKESCRTIHYPKVRKLYKSPNRVLLLNSTY